MNKLIRELQKKLVENISLKIAKEIIILINKEQLEKELKNKQDKKKVRKI